MVSARVDRLLHEKSTVPAAVRVRSRRALVVSVVVHCGLLIPVLWPVTAPRVATEIVSFAVEASLLRPDGPPPLPVPLPEVQHEASADVPFASAIEVPPIPDPTPVSRETSWPGDPLPARDAVKIEHNERIRAEVRVPAEAANTSREPDRPAAAAESVAMPAVLQPIAGSNRSPTYPAAARRHHVEGLTMVRIEVDADGRAIACRVIASSGSVLLDDAALSAAREWRFAGGPGVIDVPFRFELIKPS